MTIQRAITHSDTEDLDRDGCTPDVTTIKRTTAVDTTRRVYIGDEKYHAVLGCVQGEYEEATIATAIEQDLPPCKRCQPPDYREGTTAASNEATTEEEKQGRDEDDAHQHGSADEITLPLPESKPTCVDDLDPFVCSQGDIRRTAHIPANGGDHPEPLCVVVGTYNSPSSWTIKSQAAYPEPSAWFDLCGPCRVAYDRIEGGEEP